MILKYRFPIVHFYGDDPEDSEITYCTGKIIAVKARRFYSDVVVMARGFSFHIIFGKYQNGWYLCIPALMYGCDLAHPNDTQWNIESMTKTTTELCYEDATAIAYGIAILQKQIDQI